MILPVKPKRALRNATMLEDPNVPKISGKAERTGLRSISHSIFSGTASR